MSERKGEGESEPSRGSPKAPRDDMRRQRNLLMTMVIVFGVTALVLVNHRLAQDRPLTANQLAQALEQGTVDELRIWTNELKADVIVAQGSSLTARSGERIRTYHFVSPEEAARLSEKAEALAKGRDGRPKVHREPASLFLYNLAQLLPWLVVLGILWYFLFRQMRGMGQAGGLLSFGKSRAQLASPDKSQVTFKDVAGIDDAKHEVQEIVEFLKSPDKFKKLGGRIPRGVLLVGVPGCGKTLLAKAIAGEAGVPFFSMCGSDFVEMFVGVGASRVRDLFRQAKEKSPCIVFLDEIDAVGRRRGTGIGGGHDEREQTLNAILVEMDGFETDEGVIVFASTNRPDVLDPALLRPGRFDREVVLDLPDLVGREEILKVHMREVKLAEGVDVRGIARGTPSFSGAELAALVNEAAIIAAMRGKNDIGMEDLEEARDKVKWGRQKRSKIMTEDDRKVTAYHEAGHALLAMMLEDVEPLHKVTIIPRGPSLGATMQLPERDEYHFQKKRMMGILSLLYGGRIAEKLFCGDISAGASSDIARASKLARQMVCEWGMSSDLGPISYTDTEEMVGGRDVVRHTFSEETAVMIDKEVRAIIDKAYQRAEQLITRHKDQVEAIAKALLKYETLSGADVQQILKGEAPSAAEQRQAEQKDAKKAAAKENKEAAPAADAKVGDPKPEASTESLPASAREGAAEGAGPAV